MARTIRVPQFSACMPAPAWRRTLAERLFPWFRRHQRNLPWRQSRDAYRVWVSEIMLQQTQVATVIPYFERFLAAFPSVRDLAAADEHEVLRLWEGLGYYRRARQMHAAARIVSEQHDGNFPDTFEAIRTLPGVGRYTAGAILSIAYDRPAPILEANTIRLLSRLFALSGDVSTAAAQGMLWQLAEAIVPPSKCGAFNQALMELGSLVCTPKVPRCDTCPVRDLCAAFQKGRQDEIPAPRARPNFEQVREAAVVVYKRGKVFVRLRQPGERWAGLWDFVRFPIAASRGTSLRTELADKTRLQAGLAIGDSRRIATLKHGVTRFRITLDCYRAPYEKSRVHLPTEQWRWLAPEALSELPLSTTGRKLSRLLLEE
jgi:A/G-specific adenine glycosylase